jgi:serine/threonine protein kinase
MTSPPSSTARTVAGRYRIESVLGRGGFAQTYRGVDLESGHRVAIKELSLEHVGDWKTVELFEREARTLRSLDHPRIPHYIDFLPVEAERTGYLVQSLAPGRPVDEWLERGRRFSEEECLGIARQLLEILDYLQSLRPPVVHRDITPSNVILDDDQQIYLVDFGAVRNVALPSGGSTVVGTFGYMAPEQLHGGATPGSDLYGVGMTLIHMLSGIEPSEMQKKRLRVEYRRHLNLSRPFAAFLDSLVAPMVEDRFGTAEEALDALDRTASTPSRGMLRIEDESEAISDLVKAKERREHQAQVVRERRQRKELAALARQRAEDRSYAAMATDQDGIVLEYRPRVLRDLSPREQSVVDWLSSWVFLLGYSVSLVAIIVFAIQQLMQGSVLIPGILGMLFIVCAGLGLYLLFFFGPLGERFRLRVTGDGHYALHRRRPFEVQTVGCVEHLRIAVTPPKEDARYGWLEISSREGHYRYGSISERDAEVMERFCSEVERLRALSSSDHGH